MTKTVERIANLACLLDDPMQERLWEYAELLYVEQVAFESTDPDAWVPISSARAAGKVDPEWRNHEG